MENNISNFEEQLLKAFIGNNYEKIAQKKFSVPALLLSWIYTLYRKIYLPSIIGMIAIILLGFLPSMVYYIIVFAFVIILGINFNKWYIEYAKKQIRKIKLNNQNISENELISICKEKGGTNVGLAILIYAIFAIVSSLFNPNVSQLYNSNDEIMKLLNSNSYFQDSVGVGSNFSGIYHFKDNNTFVFSDKNNIIENNQIIYSTGTWEYKDNNLKLIIKEQYKVNNGTQIDDPIKGKILTDYTIEYSTKEITDNYNIIISSADGLKYIGGDVILYGINLTEEEEKMYFNENIAINNENTSCSLKVDNANIFLKKIDELSLNCKEYEVSYNNLKYTVKKTYDEEYGGNYNIEKIYYMDNELKYIADNKKEYANLDKSYLLGSSNNNNDFLLIFNELPVRQIPKKYMIVFSENGDIKLLNTTTSDILYNEETKELSFNTKKEEFNDLNFLTCDVIKRYDNEVVYSNTYTYKYSNGKLDLIKTEDITMGKLQQQHNCN